MAREVIKAYSIEEHRKWQKQQENSDEVLVDTEQLYHIYRHDIRNTFLLKMLVSGTFDIAETDIMEIAKYLTSNFADPSFTKAGPALSVIAKYNNYHQLSHFLEQESKAQKYNYEILIRRFDIIQSFFGTLAQETDSNALKYIRFLMEVSFGKTVGNVSRFINENQKNFLQVAQEQGLTETSAYLAKVFAKPVFDLLKLSKGNVAFFELVQKQYQHELDNLKNFGHDKEQIISEIALVEAVHMHSITLNLHKQLTKIGINHSKEAELCQNLIEYYQAAEKGFMNIAASQVLFEAASRGNDNVKDFLALLDKYQPHINSLATFTNNEGKNLREVAEISGNKKIVSCLDKLIPEKKPEFIEKALKTSIKLDTQGNHKPRVKFISSEEKPDWTTKAKEIQERLNKSYVQKS